MNVAEIFIRRPVMTALVMLGILMFGIMGYRLLPVSDLPNVDFPTILVSASLAGRNARHHGVGGGAAAGETVLDHCRRGLDDLVEHAGLNADHAAVQPEPQSGRGGAGCAVDDCESCARSAAEPAQPAFVSESKSRRSADSLSVAEFAYTAAFGCGRIRRNTDGAAHLDGEWRGAGERVWGAEVCGSRQARSQGSGQPADRH